MKGLVEMMNIKLTINAPCEYAEINKQKMFYCAYHQRAYKGFSRCNERCSIGKKKIEAMEKVIQIVIERKKND